MKIEVNDWKEFRIGDLFDVYLSKDDIQPKHLQEGDTPLISSGKEKNGVVAYITDDNAKLWDANTLTVDMFGKVFYQNSPYYCVSHGRVNILYPKTKLNEKVLQFVASVIEQVSANKYDFADMCTAGKIKNDVIFLPATPSGSPDWDYMEAYMKEMEEKAKERLNRLEEMRKQEKKRIDVSGWGEFKVEELFEIVKMRDKLTNKDIYMDGKTPVYSSTTDNNGIVGYTDLDADYIVNEKVERLVLFGDHTKSFFIAEESFCTMDNVKILIPKNFNKYCIRYILTVWKAMIPDLGYSRHWNVAKVIKIFLPVTSDGAPDWACMEQYMREMEEKAKKRLEKLL